MTGPLALHGNALTPLEAVPLQQVETIADERALAAVADVAVAAKTLSISISSDHQPYNTSEQRALMTTLLSDLASLKPDYHFVLGDLVHNGANGVDPTDPLTGYLWDEWFDAIDAAGWRRDRLWVLAGNHDCNLSGSNVDNTTRNTVTEYTRRTGRPPVYAITHGNIAFVFCGYEGYKSVSQDNSDATLDGLERLLKILEPSYSIILCTHAQFASSGLFRFSPSNEWDYLRSTPRWYSIFDNYRIDAHFCGHCATDIVAADESDDGAWRVSGVMGGPWKTYTTRTNVIGHTTAHFLGGPHLEQSNWNPSHNLGSLFLSVTDGGSSATVKMRNSTTHSWVSTKERSFPLRFPVKLGRDMVFRSVPPSLGPSQTIVGIDDVDTSATGYLTPRRLAHEYAWVNYLGGNVPIGANLVTRWSLPSNVVTAGGYMQIGAYKITEPDGEKAAGLACWATNAAGVEELHFVPNAAGQYIWQGDRYPTSKKLPCFFADFEGGSIAAGANPIIITGFTERADDFNQFDPATGVMTVAVAGRYEITGLVQFNGATGCFADNIRVYGNRDRAGSNYPFGMTEAQLSNVATDIRVVSIARALVSLNVGDLVTLRVDNWDPSNKHLIARASFCATWLNA